MSRSRHPRRPTPTGDTLSRVTQAAIALADQINRLNRAHEQLVRALEAARDEGYDDGHIRGAIVIAGRGRPDRVRALERLAESRPPTGA